MRFALVATVVCLPTMPMAEDRFGDWVSAQLGYEPVYNQSIGWDMAEFSVGVTDPMNPSDQAMDFIATPQTTAWVVGMSANEEDPFLAGMALVWSDGPFDRVVEFDPPISQSGIIAYQTPAQINLSGDLTSSLAMQLEPNTPGPILARLSDGSDFAVGDSGQPDQCFRYSALYKSNDDLVALVVLFQSHLRDDADATACAPLTS
mgnify:FL=1